MQRLMVHRFQKLGFDNIIESERTNEEKEKKDCVIIHNVCVTYI